MRGARLVVAVVVAASTIVGTALPALAGDHGPTGTLLPPVHPDHAGAQPHARTGGRRGRPLARPARRRSPASATGPVARRAGAVGRPSSWPSKGRVWFGKRCSPPDGSFLVTPIGGYLFGTGVVDPNGNVTRVFGVYCAGPGSPPPPPPPPPPAAADVWQGSR